MLLSLLLIVATTQSQTSTSVIDPSLIASREFEPIDRVRREETSTGGDVVRASFQRHTVDGGQITIDIQRWTQAGGRERHMARIDSGLPHGPYAEWPINGWSGYPLGELSRRSVNPGEGLAQMYAYVDPYILSLQINHQAVVERGLTSWLGSDKPGDRLALEGFGRDTLANAIGGNLRPARNAIVNGRQIAETKSDDSGNVFVPVQDWCTAWGLSLAVNRQHGTLSFIRSGVMHVLAVAANEAKRGSEWLDLGGFVVRAEGKHYAPLEGLESLL